MRAAFPSRNPMPRFRIRRFIAPAFVFAVACAARPPEPSSPAQPTTIGSADPGTPVESPPVAGAEPGSVAGGPEPGAPTDPEPGAPAGIPGTVWKERDLGVSVPDAWRACQSSSECALVVTTCCDHCNGGKAVAVEKGHLADVQQKYPKNCGRVACTERGCFTRAACNAGRCVLEWASAP